MNESPSSFQFSRPFSSVSPPHFLPSCSHHFLISFLLSRLLPVLFPAFPFPFSPFSFLSRFHNLKFGIHRHPSCRFCSDWQTMFMVSCFIFCPLRLRITKFVNTALPLRRLKMESIFVPWIGERFTICASVISFFPTSIAGVTRKC